MSTAAPVCSAAVTWPACLARRRIDKPPAAVKQDRKKTKVPRREACPPPDLAVFDGLLAPDFQGDRTFSLIPGAHLPSHRRIMTFPVMS
jgi:hypothetical protein